MSASHEILELAAEALVADPSASLAEVAKVLGVGRTTLHKRYPTRHALLLAVAHDCVNRIEAAVAETGVPDVSADASAEDLAGLFRGLVAALVPMGVRLEFLLRQPSLDGDAELTARIEALDDPVAEFVAQAQRAGVLHTQLSVWWVMSTLYAVTYSAWEGVRTGRVAPLDAADLAARTVLCGLGGPG